MPKNNLLMLPVDVVRAALLFMPSSDLRLYLNGLYVTVKDGDVLAMASDGMSLYRHEIPDYAGIEDVALIIPQFIVKLALTRAKKQKLDFIALDVDEHFFGDIGFKPIALDYPGFDMDALKSGVRDEVHTTYDVGLLQRLQQVCGILSDDSPVLPRLKHYGRCATLWLNGGSTAVVMVQDI